MSSGENWKWWYFVLAGIGIGGYSIWQSYTTGSIRPLGSLFLAGVCILVGFWSRKREAKETKEKAESAPQ
jgi:hypothetical protein